MNKRELIKTNKEYYSKIDEKYIRDIESIDCYIRAELNSIDAELAINQMLKDFSALQSNQEQITSFIKSSNEYAANLTSKYKKSYSYDFFSLLVDYLPIGIYAIIFLLFLDIINNALKQKTIRFIETFRSNYPVETLVVVALLLVFLLGISLVKKFNKVNNSKKKGGIIIYIILFLIISALLIITSIQVSKMGILVIVKFSSWSIVILLLIIGIIVFIISSLLKIIIFKKNINVK